MNKRAFLNAAEVAAELGSSKAYAYKLIRILNRQLEEKGYITMPGKISRNYFNEKIYGGMEQDYACIQRQ